MIDDPSCKSSAALSPEKHAIRIRSDITTLRTSL
jgi:hypothetical protein